MSAAGWAWVFVVSTCGAALFATLFHAVRDLPRASLEGLIQARGTGAASARATRILGDLDGHANAVAFPRVLCTVASVMALVFWVHEARGVAPVDWLSTAVAGLISVGAFWIFGVAIPQGVARHAAAETVYAWSGTLRVIYAAARPFVAVVGFADEVVRRLAGRPDEPPKEQLEAALLSVVDEARHGGQFDGLERDMISAVVRFKEKTVQQIMTPRTEMEAMELTNNLGEVTQAIRRCGHSRIPVYDGSPDKIVGVFYVKDLMRWLAGEGRAGKSFELKAVLRPAQFVPETKTIRELLSELVEKKVHIALVADEYGGVAGLVTIEDILEEIVGPIQDEYEHGQEEVPEVIVDEGARTAEIDARAYIEDANHAVRVLGVEIPQNEDYDTVGGFVTVSSGRIPVAGEQLRLDGLLVTILEAEPTRVTRIRLEAAPEAAHSRDGSVDAAGREDGEQSPGRSEVESTD